jgi:hypothetical protein
VFLSSYHRQGEKMKVSCHVFETWEPADKT